MSSWVSGCPSRGSKRFTPESGYESAWCYSAIPAILFFAELRGCNMKHFRPTTTHRLL